MEKGRFGTIDGLIQRMRGILDAIVCAFNGQGFTSPEAVSQRMENGVLKERVAPKPIEPSKSEAIAPDRHDMRAVADMWRDEGPVFAGSVMQTAREAWSQAGQQSGRPAPVGKALDHWGIAEREGLSGVTSVSEPASEDDARAKSVP